MTERRKTPPQTESEVLIMSARRCCVCFGIQTDLSIKKGQVAHLDHNPSNTAMDNLAFLCIPHHDDYDSKTSQSKGLAITEVKKYRTLLYKAINQMRNERLSVDDTKNASGVESDGPTLQITSLLSRVQSRTTPLSQCLVEGMDLARKLGDEKLEDYCRDELSGYPERSRRPPAYRTVDVFISATQRVNMDSLFWGNNPNSVIEYLRHDRENFTPAKFHMYHSISIIEAHAENAHTDEGIVELSLKASDVNPKAETPNAHVVGYAHPRYFQKILEGVRTELTVLLLNLLQNSRYAAVSPT